jgi:hypothetical protein
MKTLLRVAAILFAAWAVSCAIQTRDPLPGIINTLERVQHAAERRAEAPHITLQTVRDQGQEHAFTVTLAVENVPTKPSGVFGVKKAKKKCGTMHCVGKGSLIVCE